ncbi:MAG: ATP synthase F1 subunit gamma [Elusimicrobia bacterium RIFCSPLOWO2_02_FULL_39_32]|nr:MAG: ATP synthase F1 subunit gamma [Elusimicrobia bacterium GWA2_38_7]OGR78452.1 MAG: ATP synthase F1 subunit gamma [Elusimicrobia bacterium RIFCSPHIGHO2_02_FULL_39_36]OGR92211.1 MAG: ATP synthase F1 subunit gamma [Elusimicrobia bacterium RIFCSPLOWO2_02_FULL_39_32]OGR99922.1 MAG: ATP synthase F1 subunit gamma [Elusimicrobia bacterium RIFCSPLOWO2_12_FULL_39_28]
MSSLREYRKKIKTIRSTEQITKAMKMVAAARLRRAQSRILAARPFAFKMRDLLSDLAARILQNEDSNAEELFSTLHPLLRTNQTNRIALLLVTADKGLCGSFNTNLIKKAVEVLKENENKEILFFVVGRKGRDFFKRVGASISGETINIFNNLSYIHAELIGSELIKAYLQNQLAEVVVVYNEFKSVIQQRLVVERLLPIAKPLQISQEQKTDFIYEPKKELLLEGLLPRYVKSQIFRILLESSAAELGARMAAMDSATKNASELIDLLTLKLNRTRQAIITREIAELVGGAEALK